MGEVEGARPREVAVKITNGEMSVEALRLLLLATYPHSKMSVASCRSGQGILPLMSLFP